MSDKPRDPETFLTKETIGSRKPKPTIEKRLGKVTGKHTFEVCLIETYLNTKEFLGAYPDIDENLKLRHLYGIKTEILRYCIPSKIEWRKLLEGHKSGQLIVKPSSRSDIYYRLLAYNLFLLEPWQCSRFLDFHLVHCVINPSRKKTNSQGNLKIDFLQHLEYQITQQIRESMALRRDDIFSELITWNRKQLDLLTKEELTKYYEYKFVPHMRRSIGRMTSKHSQAKYAGCDEKLLKKYFHLLLNSPFEDGNPFMPENSINFLLWKWFGIGYPQSEPKYLVYLTLEQLVYFLREFLNNFQISKSPDKKAINQKELVNLAFEYLPGVFGDYTATTVYKKFTGLAEQGCTPALDWRNNQKLVKAIKKLGDTKNVT